MKWLFVLFSLIGDYLNIQKHWQGFLFWMACDIYFASYNFFQGEYAEMALFTIYLFFAMYGLWAWKPKPKDFTWITTYKDE